MRAENFVFKIKFFAYSKNLEKIRKGLVTFLENEGYSYVNPISSLYNFLSMTFMLNTLSISPPITLKLKKIIGLLDDKRLKQEIYFQTISKLRDDVPYEINIFMYFGKWKESDGIIVEVISKPAIYFKITQLLYSPNLVSKEKYSFIDTENRIFLEKIAKAIHGYVIENPKPLNFYIENELIEKLKFFGFEKVAEILKKGKEKIELGDSSGLDELRGAIENFLHDIIIKLGATPNELHECEKNISLLKNLGFINEEIERLIRSVLYKGVYVFLSDVKTHHREDVDLFTSRLCFELSEVVFNYLIERVVRYKVKVS
jgi:hypothetical protein